MSWKIYDTLRGTGKDSGFTVSKYVGNGDKNRYIGLGLGMEPSMVIVKNKGYSKTIQENEIIETHRDFILDILREKFPEDFI